MSLLLLDTQLLVWGAVAPDRLSAETRALLSDTSHQQAFSVVSVWEVAIKMMLGRADFRLDPRRLRRSLLDGGCREMALTGDHAVAIVQLPPLHQDPFDRLMIAQARCEGAVLLTADTALVRYGDPVRLVR